MPNLTAKEIIGQINSAEVPSEFRSAYILHINGMTELDFRAFCKFRPTLPEITTRSIANHLRDIERGQNGMLARDWIKQIKGEGKHIKKVSTK